MFKPNATNPELRKINTYSIKEKTRLLREQFEKIENIYSRELEELSNLDQAEFTRTKDHEDDDDYYDGYATSLADISLIYLRMHRYSAIIAACTYLESCMTHICTEKEKIGKFTTSFSDYPGKGIVRCYEYMKKIVRTDFDGINRIWSQIRILNQLRNCIVHCGGDYERLRNPEKFKSVMDTTKGVSIAEEKLLMVSEEYVLQAFKNIEMFLIFTINANDA